MQYFKNTIKYFLNYIAYFGLKTNLPFLTFLKLALLTKKISNTKNNKKILVFHKSGGMDDLYSVYYKKKVYFDTLILARSNIKVIFHYFVKRSDDYNTFINFNSDKELINNRIKYKKFLKKIIKYYKFFFRISIIANFNLTNLTDWDLATASKENNIKFITLHKECTKSFGKRILDELMYKKYIKKYSGDKIVVYNHDEKNVLVKSEIIKKKNIFVVGCSRIDYSFEIGSNKKNNSKKLFTIIYYAIQDVVSLPYIRGKFYNLPNENLENYTWNNNASKFEKILFEYMCQNKNINLIIKTKTGNPDQIKRLKKFEQFKNVKIINEGTGSYLLKYADLCIAFNSTIIYEAMASIKPVLIPLVDIKKQYKKFTFDFSQTTNIFEFETKKKFFELMKKFLNKEIKFDQKISEMNLKKLEIEVGNSDGKSGKRLNNFIFNELK